MYSMNAQLVSSLRFRSTTTAMLVKYVSSDPAAYIREVCEILPSITESAETIFLATGSKSIFILLALYSSQHEN